MTDVSWKDAVVRDSESIEKVIIVLNESSLQIALVVDRDDNLIGTITDGDIRRAFLRHIDLTSNAADIMNDHPVVASNMQTESSIIKMMEDNSVSHIPIIDTGGKLCGLETLQRFLSPTEIDTPVFIMAGGFGTRLAPMTDACPKPMLPVGGVPILEKVILNFAKNGFRNFYVSVHYLSAQVMNYFGDGSNWGVNITYISEEAPLGTAGALSLLPNDAIKDDMIVINGDVLTSVNFKHLLSYHRDSRAVATMAIRKYSMQVPFGVVKIKDDRLTEVKEKPVHDFFVNAGIYVLTTKALSMLKRNEHMDMPQLFSMLVNADKVISTFPIHEDWVDIGRLEEYKQVNQAYHEALNV